MASNTLDTITLEFTFAVAPLRQAISSPEAFRGFMANLGWTVEDIPAPILNLGSSLDEIDTALPAVLGSNPTFNDFNRLREALEDLFTAIGGLESATFDAALAIDNFADKFPKQLVQHLLIEYLLARHPRIAFVLRILGLIRVRFEARSSNRSDFVLRRELVWADFTELINDPVLVFERVYGWRTPNLDFRSILQNAENLTLAIGVSTYLQTLDDSLAHVLENNASYPEILSVGT